MRRPRARHVMTLVAGVWALAASAGHALSRPAGHAGDPDAWRRDYSALQAEVHDPSALAPLLARIQQFDAHVGVIVVLVNHKKSPEPTPTATAIVSATTPPAPSPSPSPTIRITPASASASASATATASAAAAPTAAATTTTVKPKPTATVKKDPLHVGSGLD